MLNKVSSCHFYIKICFQSRDEEYLEMLIEQEKHDSEIRRQIIEEEEKREKNTKIKNKEALIDELVFVIIFFFRMTSKSLISSTKIFVSGIQLIAALDIGKTCHFLAFL